MWPRTDLLNLLGINHPIVQAPMSGFSSPALVTAVSNAGALGSLGCATPPKPFVTKSTRFVEPRIAPSI